MSDWSRWSSVRAREVIHLMPRSVSITMANGWNRLRPRGGGNPFVYPPLYNGNKVEGLIWTNDFTWHVQRFERRSITKRYLDEINLGVFTSPRSWGSSSLSILEIKVRPIQRLHRGTKHGDAKSRHSHMSSPESSKDESFAKSHLFAFGIELNNSSLWKRQESESIEWCSAARDHDFLAARSLLRLSKSRAETPSQVK